MIVCAPVESAAVASEAVPPESAELPSEVAPLKNVTRPVGLPAPGAVTRTVAVSVVDCPNTVGFGLLETLVAVAAVLTTCVVVADALPV